MVRNFKSKICERCKKKYVPNSSFQKYCSECRPIINKEWHRRWRKEHPECRQQYYLKNKEHIKQWVKNHPEQEKKYKKQWRLENPDKVIEIRSKRRELGFIPLNEPFKDSVAHHINDHYVIYIPIEMHRSVFHKQGDWDSMLKINKLSFQYLIDNG